MPMGYYKVSFIRVVFVIFLVQFHPTYGSHDDFHPIYSHVKLSVHLESSKIDNAYAWNRQNEMSSNVVVGGRNTTFG